MYNKKKGKNSTKVSNGMDSSSAELWSETDPSFEMGFKKSAVVPEPNYTAAVDTKRTRRVTSVIFRGDVGGRDVQMIYDHLMDANNAIDHTLVRILLSQLGVSHASDVPYIDEAQFGVLLDYQKPVPRMKLAKLLMPDIGK